MVQSSNKLSSTCKNFNFRINWYISKLYFSLTSTTFLCFLSNSCIGFETTDFPAHFLEFRPILIDEFQHFCNTSFWWSYGFVLNTYFFICTFHYFNGSWCKFVGGKKAKAMKGMKRRAMRKKKAAAAEEAPMKAMRRK